MKSILLSIKPKWVAKILNGEKTIEIRKNKALYKATMKLIEEQGYATFFMYCSKNGYGLIKLKEAGIKPFYPKEYDIEDGQTLPNLNGKVIAKYTVRKVEHFEYDTCSRDICGYWLDNGEVFNIKKTCLTSDEMFAYIGGKDGYAYHIEDLVIFDKPKELSEFHKIGKYCQYSKDIFSREWYCEWCKKPDCIGDELTKAPQNFCYVESKE